MKQILLLSDTHSFLDPALQKYIEEADEVWHAGDIGDIKLLETLENQKITRAVYGNIDGHHIRAACPLNLFFTCEGVRVWMTHIGGYPGRYTQRIRKYLEKNASSIDLFICGHSHILKVIPDEKHQLLHMNPGACGRHGFHHMKTALRFTVAKGRIQTLEAIELGPRARE